MTPDKNKTQQNAVIARIRAKKCVILSISHETSLNPAKQAKNACFCGIYFFLGIFEIFVFSPLTICR